MPLFFYLSTIEMERWQELLDARLPGDPEPVVWDALDNPPDRATMGRFRGVIELVVVPDDDPRRGIFATSMV